MAYTPISDLQRMLRILEPTDTLTVDGIYGEETQAAVVRFQRGNDLPVTGIADQQTYDAVKRAYQREAVFFAQAEPLRIVLQPQQVIERGSENTHLYLIQALLVAMRRYYIELPGLSVTGVLDEDTARSVRWFQAHCGLPVTGEVDKDTWRHLAKQYRLIVGDGSGTVPVRIAEASPDTERTQSSEPQS